MIQFCSTNVFDKVCLILVWFFLQCNITFASCGTFIWRYHNHPFTMTQEPWCIPNPRITKQLHPFYAWMQTCNHNPYKSTRTHTKKNTLREKHHNHTATVGPDAFCSSCLFNFKNHICHRKIGPPNSYAGSMVAFHHPMPFVPLTLFEFLEL